MELQLGSPTTSSSRALLVENDILFITFRSEVVERIIEIIVNKIINKLVTNRET